MAHIHNMYSKAHTNGFDPQIMTEFNKKWGLVRKRSQNKAVCYQVMEQLGV